jgi:hypothetical protein
VRTGLAPSQGHLDSSDFIGQPGLLLAHLTKVHGLDQGQVTGTLQQQADDATIFQHLADTHRSAQH